MLLAYIFAILKINYNKMAKQRTVFGELSYAKPTSQFVGGVEVNAGLNRLDAAADRVRSIGTQPINSLDTDVGIQQDYVNSQYDSIQEIQDIAKGSSLYEANALAKQLALKSNQQKNTTGNVYYQANLNEASYRNQLEALSKEATKFGNLGSDLIAVNSTAGKLRYDDAGGAITGKYDKQTGLPLDGSKLNSISINRPAEDFDEEDFKNKLGSGFKADIIGRLKSSGGNYNVYEHITDDRQFIEKLKSEQKAVSFKDVYSYSKNTIEQSDKYKRIIEEAQLQEINDLVSQGASFKDAVREVKLNTDSEASKKAFAIANAKVDQMSKDVANKFGFTENTKERTIKESTERTAGIRKRLENQQAVLLTTMPTQNVLKNNPSLRNKKALSQSVQSLEGSIKELSDLYKEAKTDKDTNAMESITSQMSTINMQLGKLKGFEKDLNEKTRKRLTPEDKELLATYGDFIPDRDLVVTREGGKNNIEVVNSVLSGLVNKDLITTDQAKEIKNKDVSSFYDGKSLAKDIINAIDPSKDAGDVLRQLNNVGETIEQTEKDWFKENIDNFGINPTQLSFPTKVLEETISDNYNNGNADWIVMNANGVVIHKDSEKPGNIIANTVSTEPIGSDYWFGVKDQDTGEKFFIMPNSSNTAASIVGQELLQLDGTISGSQKARAAGLNMLTNRWGRQLQELDPSNEVAQPFIVNEKKIGEVKASKIGNDVRYELTADGETHYFSTIVGPNVYLSMKAADVLGIPYDPNVTNKAIIYGLETPEDFLKLNPQIIR